MIRSFMTVVTPLVCLLFSSGCGGEDRAPFQAGGRQVQDWVTDLKSPKATVRRQAVHKLGNVGDADPAAAIALGEALRDPDTLVRHDAILGILKIEKPDRTTLEALALMASSDPDIGIRELARKALLLLESRRSA